MAKTVEELDFTAQRDSNGNLVSLQYRYWLTDTAADGSTVYYDRAPRVRRFGSADMPQALGRSFADSDPTSPPLEQVLAQVKAQVEAEEGV